MAPQSVRTLLRVAAAAATIFSIAPADAFQAKHSPTGKPVHWPSGTVDFVLSPALNRAAENAQGAAAEALAAWSGVSAGPTLRAQSNDDAPSPKLDGTNVVTYAGEGYAAATGALAVTVLTYDDDTGAILDCDIVLNGRYNFAILDESARPASGVTGVSTEGGGAIHGHAPFDLVHVLAHEAGHSLGLSDEPSRNSALMYPFTTPGDASSRLPSDDDDQGVASLYATTSDASGCAIGHTSALSTEALLFIASSLLVVAFLRRRTRGARIALFAVGGLVSFAAFPARAWTVPSEIRSETAATVTDSLAIVRDGVFTTELTLAVEGCRSGECPALTHATMWGGHYGGVTQEIAGMPVPVVGERVLVSLDAHDNTHARMVSR